MNPSTPILIVRKALWKPRWFKLDQSIQTGQSGQFAFYDQPTGEADIDGQCFEFTFFSRLESETHRCEFRFARILEINHPTFGSIERVDTHGLDYIFYPTTGSEKIVNAEEEPGVIYDFDMQVESWSLTVTLADVSEPISNSF